MNHVLIVDDDADSAATMRELVGMDQFSVAIAHSLREARRQIAMQPPCLVLLDLQLPDGSGMELLSHPPVVDETKIVLITGHASLDSSIEALRLGAMDYLVKPVRLNRLEQILERIKQSARNEADAPVPASGPGHGEPPFGRLWGSSTGMLHVREQIGRVAGTSVTVFITGESGTGKEVVAQTLHELSPRRAKPFLAVICGAISPNLIESEIFGHEKGSFTGADRLHQGFFERAAGGTLFLDEVTEMPLELQVKLLRVLETGRFMRVGSTQSLASYVRIVAATNRPPLEAVAEGRLREDLLYRLNVFPIELPPLRQRLCDVPVLAEHFLRDISEREQRPKRFSPAALRQLEACEWPGNVRELRNVVQRAYLMTPEEIVGCDWLPRPEAQGGAGGAVPRLPAPAGAPAASVPGPLAPPGGDFLADAGRKTLTLPIGVSIAQAERQLIEATLEHCRFQKERTAAVLGISLKTLYNRLKRYAD